jgi:hypothetical protein
LKPFAAIKLPDAKKIKRRGVFDSQENITLSSVHIWIEILSWKLGFAVDLAKGGPGMKFIELTMPLNHQWMPDEVLPTSVKFFLGPKNHQEKGIVVGSETGTCLMLASVFMDFRKTARLDEVPVEKLFLRDTTVAAIAK